ncbi:hypothetical protein E2C01_027485 [Portunus trituberculatus]|uniref:Uncharacterized protein n=1 Tax=Portunus trituberculatus TaxID=210409 RepID=A0A5B7ELN3_PORTR|nr:hypothetical protein [Portunus trituberculatus]
MKGTWTLGSDGATKPCAAVHDYRGHLQDNGILRYTHHKGHSHFTDNALIFHVASVPLRDRGLVSTRHVVEELVPPQSPQRLDSPLVICMNS